MDELAIKASSLVLERFDPPTYGIPEAVAEAATGNIARVPAVLANVQRLIGRSIIVWEQTVTAQEASDALLRSVAQGGTFGASTISEKSPNTGKKKSARRVV